MAQEIFHVTSALDRNRETIDGLVTDATNTEYSEIGPLALLRAVRFRRQEYSHVIVGSSTVADYPLDEDLKGALYGFQPTVSFMLLARPEDETGLTTEIGYDRIDLKPRDYERLSIPRDLGGLLVPAGFLVAYGEIFEPITVLDAGALGGEAELGPVARIAATTIQATCEALAAQA